MNLQLPDRARVRQVAAVALRVLRAINGGMLNASKLVLVLMTLAAACGGDDAPVAGVATESVCPTVSPPTYDSFGKQFMTAYCVKCHSSEKVGAARNGAPEFHDFDTLEGILLVAEHVDEYAAAGPAGVNTLMPKINPKPSEAERRKLGEWLACEALTANQDAGNDAGQDTDAGQ